MTGDSDFEVKHVGSANIEQFSQHPFLILVQGWSLTLSSARVCNCTNLYPIITKLIVLFKSRSGNVAFDLDKLHY